MDNENLDNENNENNENMDIITQNEGPGQTKADELGLNEFEDTSNEIAEEDEGFEPLGSTGDVSAIYNIPVQISAVLGHAVMPVNQLLKLGRGAVIKLDRRVGESLDIFVNNKLVARGEVVMIDDRLGITMTEIIKSDR
jgi:flagellar motor switch protein FliN/FliY